MKKSNKIIDLFCGVGGFSLGFEMSGFESVLAIDHWSDAVKTYNFNRKKEIATTMDIHELNSEMLKSLQEQHDIVGIIGGPPCQGFSTVGTRSIDDERNHLYLEYFRVVKEVRPKFFVIENVKGLMTLNKGMFKKDILERFGSLGYNITEPKVLNASHYGVPQMRERVFFVGILDNDFTFPHPFNYTVSAKEAISDLPSLEDINGFLEIYPYEIEPQSEYQSLMRENSVFITNHNETKHSQQTIDVIKMVPDGGGIKDLPSEYWNIRKYNKAFQRMNSNLPSHTIDTGHRNYFHYKENRIPSVRECARIQSFPDHFQFIGAKSSQYKQVGNAVPPLLGKAIADEIMKLI